MTTSRAQVLDFQNPKVLIPVFDAIRRLLAEGLDSLYILYQISRSIHLKDTSYLFSVLRWQSY